MTFNCDLDLESACLSYGSTHRLTKANMRERRLCYIGTAVLWLYIAGSFHVQHERKAFMLYRYS